MTPEELKKENNTLPTGDPEAEQKGTGHSTSKDIGRSASEDAENSASKNIGYSASKNSENSASENIGHSAPSHREAEKAGKTGKSGISRNLAIPFFLVMAVLTVVSFIIPLRPTRSYSEKRSLKEFPAFSWTALTSGDYFDDITEWFSDTFPGRETWLSASSKISSLHGINDVSFSSGTFQADAVPVINKDESSTSDESSAEEASESDTADSESDETAVTGEASGDEGSDSSSEEAENSDGLSQETSDSSADENGDSEEADESEESSIVTIEAPEGSVEEWGGIDAGDEADVIYGNVLQIGDSAFSYFGFTQYTSDQFVAQVNRLARNLEDRGTRVVCALIPSAVGVMVAPEYQEKLHCSEQNAVEEYILGSMDDIVYKVNMFPNLVAHNDEYLYFRTDHHETARGAYYGYQSICETLGFEARPLEDFTELDEGTYIGSLYWKASQPESLLKDTVYAYIPPDYDQITYKISDDGYSFWDYDMIADLSNSGEESKYMCFLAGDHALSLAVNDAIPDGKTCVVIKDSCGNPMIPYLIENYHKVYVLDFRAYGNENISTFVKENDVDDVILCLMLGMVQDDGAISIFDWMLK